MPATSSIVRIDVTAEDLARGKPKDPKLCPIALAVARILNLSARQVGVTARYIRVDSWHVRIDYPVTEAVIDFDRGNPIAPFAFNLDLDRRTL